MASLNRAEVIGNLGQDPDIRYTQENTCVTTMSVASNERWTDRDGNKQERTEWHRIVAWGRLAETCGTYLRKGSLVYFAGRLQTRKYEDKQGVERCTTEIVAREMQMLDSAGGSKPPHPANEPGGASHSEPTTTSESPSSGGAPPANEPPPADDQDLPF